MRVDSVMPNEDIFDKFVESDVLLEDDGNLTNVFVKVVDVEHVVSDSLPISENYAVFVLSVILEKKMRAKRMWFL